jgi:hypothetical protein
MFRGLALGRFDFEGRIGILTPAPRRNRMRDERLGDLGEGRCLHQHVWFFVVLLFF